jgi:predicted Na+-dependent transporter
MRIKSVAILHVIILLCTFMSVSIGVQASEITGEKIYKMLSQASREKGRSGLIAEIKNTSRIMNWQDTSSLELTGNLRHLKSKDEEKTTAGIYLIRDENGKIYILSVPAVIKGSFYEGIENMLSDKMTFKVNAFNTTIGKVSYTFVQFTAKPQQVLLDRLLKICIILMLFFIMVGMGLTLTVKEFTLVFKNPRGLIIGQILQFGIMPLLAFALGYAMGFYEHFPFIFVGIILIIVSPGGVTSNLMTFYAKGDLALSISLTSFSTILSLVFTPLLLSLYCSNVPEITIPVKMVVLTITVLVILPLFIGMFIRGKWRRFAEKATPFFSALGIIALIFIIAAGILTNLDKFADINRYGLKFYVSVFSLTVLGMVVGAVIPKLIGINNYQSRAISLETGLRNSTLAMSLALLIQDYMGDFNSSMFASSAAFGLGMFVAGAIAIVLYKHLLPVTDETV